MKLLISPYSLEEARQAVEGSADIVDVKNPREGSLGANYPWVIKAVVAEVGEKAETSATLGDLNFEPGRAAQAAYGTALTGVDYIKAGVAFEGRERALELAQAVVRAVEGTARVILAGYADFQRAGAISPMELPGIAREAGASGAMVDTYIKDGRSLLHFLGRRELSGFVEEAHSYGLAVAMAGSLGREHIAMAGKLGVDVVGIRGAACSSGDRFKGRLEVSRVKELKELCSAY